MGGDAEATATLVVEERGEHAWGVDPRRTQEVDRAVHSDERDGVQVADDPVVLDRLVAHATLRAFALKFAVAPLRCKPRTRSSLPLRVGRAPRAVRARAPPDRRAGTAI